MQYHAPTNQFTVTADDLQRASHSLRWAINHIRKGSGLDPKGYKRPGPMDDAEFAEYGILKAARELGIDLGAKSPGELYVSNDR
jgi:hypothetical protein